MTTLAKKMLGYALGRTGRRLRSPARRRDGEGRRRHVIFEPGGQGRDQPSVPQPRGRRTLRQGAARHPGGRKPMSRNHRLEPAVTASLPQGRRGRPGPALDGVAAGVRGDRGRPESDGASAAAGHRLLLERRRTDALVGEGPGRGDAARPGPAADDAASGGHGVPPGPLQPDGARLDQPAPRTDERALGRPREPRPERDSRGHVDGPGPRLPDRQPHGDSEPGARHRAERASPRRRPFHDLRIELVVGLADPARDQGALPLPGVRPTGRRRQGPRSRSQHSRRGPAGFPGSAAEDQQGRQRQAGRVPRIDSEHRAAHRARIEGGAHRRVAADLDPAGHASSEERDAPERARIT